MITSFVSGSNTYTFPTSPADQSFFTNFGNVKNFMQALPGVNSGFDMFGEGRRPTEAATIQLNIYLVSSTISGMKTLRDNINKMVDWGRGRLYDTLRDGSIRWCNCWLNAIVIREERHKHTDLFQPVQLTFATDDPFWYTAGTITARYNEGLTYGGGAKYDGGATPTTITNSGTITVNYTGSAYTIPRWTIRNTSGSTVSDIKIDRIVSGGVVDSVRYNSTLANNSTLYILPLQGVFSVNGVNVYPSISFNHPDCIRFVTGTNTILVTLSGEVAVTPNYYVRYI